MNHKCYILTQNERQQKKEEKFAGYIFFDYESMCVDGEHIPNLIVCDKICCQCLNDGECENCGIHYFNDNNSFCEWLLKQNNYIPELTISILDKDGDRIYDVVLAEVIINSLSELQLSYNSSNFSEQTFSLQISYNYKYNPSIYKK
jgi:hypothetical protein